MDEKGIMNIIFRYIAKHVILATILVFAVIYILSFIITLVTELRDTGVGDYGFMQAVMHVLLMMPHILYQFFPMLMLLGGVLGLGALASSQELMAMRASGVSVNRITLAILSAALLLVFLATLIGELVAPHADYIADVQKTIAQSGGQAVATTAGPWIHEGNNFLHIDRVVNRHHLEGLTRYEFDNQHRLLAAYYAKSSDFQQGKWVLLDLSKTTFGNDQTHSEQFPLATWDIELKPRLLNAGLVEPEEMSLPRLLEYSRYLVQNRLQAGSFQFEFWKRIFQPFTTLVMILLAVPFVFGSPRSAAMGRRILFAVMVGFVFYIFNAFLGQFSVVFQVSPFIAALLPTIVFAGVGCGMMSLVE
jgi:lipopolysaccharide export system permease protein